jgi:hypothetical protein
LSSQDLLRASQPYKLLGKVDSDKLSSWSINQLCDRLEQMEQLRKEPPTPKVTAPEPHHRRSGFFGEEQ